ncbi:hypothetical protein LTR62_007456 [Meristemomyces frigidus]|uniref:N-acetyltransferase domain-containing protein n=1 Tax=Meristemomyces frigidus TaxID=1508187 RepID=A0AAN7TQ39_9PEZI|nr:hypothetical protein LTR62_007456 [Meristemomyces frigidus]
MATLTTNPFASARLLYRAPEPTDEDETWILRNLQQEPAIYTQTMWLPHVPQNRQSAKEYLKFMAEKCAIAVMICVPATPEPAAEGRPGDEVQQSGTTQGSAPAPRSMALEAADAKPIGLIHLSRLPTEQPHHRGAEIGLSIARPYQGQGYGSEAIDWILDWAFLSGGFHRVGIGAFTYNAGAVRLYRRLGFVEEGRLREVMWYAGGWEGCVLMGMLEGEWRALREGRKVGEGGGGVRGRVSGGGGEGGR